MVEARNSIAVPSGPFVDSYLLETKGQAAFDFVLSRGSDTREYTKDFSVLVFCIASLSIALCRSDSFHHVRQPGRNPSKFHHFMGGKLSTLGGSVSRQMPLGSFLHCLPSLNRICQPQRIVEPTTPTTNKPLEKEKSVIYHLNPCIHHTCTNRLPPTATRVSCHSLLSRPCR
jgi:hypothetical protein